MKEQELENAYNDLHKLSEEYWGTYSLNKFFIQINTRKPRSAVPSYDFHNLTFSDLDQLVLQRENFPALFHEHVHYVHEVSTMVGITAFHFEMISRAAFSGSVNLPHDSSINKLNEEELMVITQNKLLFTSLDGDQAKRVNDLIIYKVNCVESLPMSINLPLFDTNLGFDVPMVFFDGFDQLQNMHLEDSLFFGKFYLYEGIAYKLDRLMHKILDRETGNENLVGEEYKIMEKVAKSIVSDITDREMLDLASLSLSYLNAGEYFIGFLKKCPAKKQRAKYIGDLKLQVSNILKDKLPDVKEELGDIVKVFEKRSLLHNAIVYLTETMIEGIEKRIKNPVFEIDAAFSGVTDALQQQIRMCPMSYQFDEPEDTYMRDFAGSYNTPNLSTELLIFLCHVDFFQNHMAGREEYCCPLYTFCNESLRQKKPEICKTRPRLSYELQGEFGRCNYCMGVTYMNATDR